MRNTCKRTLRRSGVPAWTVTTAPTATDGAPSTTRVVFPLTEKHATADCAGCHPGARSVADLQAAPTACVGCHQGDDQHQGQFGADCGACHKTDSWQGATFDHSQSAFPLTGKHSQVDCVQCHANNIYKGTPQACVGCHQKDDQHQGQFGADCGACHKTDSWQGATFDHSQSAFPLTGKHSQVDCVQCHTNNVYQGTPRACVGCHRGDDQHQGRFGADCGACHKTDSWQGATFDHSQSAFPLTGKHSQVDCGQCHTNNVYQGHRQTQPGGLRPVPRQQHLQGHAADVCRLPPERRPAQGQFGAECGCVPQDRLLAGRDLRPLAERLPAHRQTHPGGLRQCHANNVYQGHAAGVCRLPPRVTTSTRGGSAPNCGACHKTDSWQGATFDHSQSAFPLTGKHSQVDCVQCHTNNVYQGHAAGVCRLPPGRRPAPGAVRRRLRRVPQDRLLAGCDLRPLAERLPAHRQTHPGGLRSVPHQQYLQGHAAGVCRLPPERRPAPGAVRRGLRRVPQDRLLAGRDLRPLAERLPAHRQTQPGGLRSVPHQQCLQRDAAGVRRLPPG